MPGCNEVPAGGFQLYSAVLRRKGAFVGRTGRRRTVRQTGGQTGSQTGRQTSRGRQRWTADDAADKRSTEESTGDAGRMGVRLLSEVEELQALLASAGVFIVTGVTKSGTTWLQRMLDRKSTRLNSSQ